MEESANEKEETTLWKSWFEDKALSVQHALIAFYHEWLLGLAKGFYSKYYLSCYELADYIHWSTIGLIESIDRYKQVKDVPFRAYAYRRIKGEVLNQISKATEQTAQYHSYKKENERDRLASLVAISSHSESFERLCNVTIGMMLGNLLDVEIEQHLEDDRLLNDVYNEQLSNNLSGFLRALSDEQRRVLIYHYFYHLKFVEIADLLALSKGRVSQLHAEALLKTKEMITNSDLEIFI